MNITWEEIMEMSQEVNRLLDEKGHTILLKQSSRPKLAVLLASEASEIAQEYKRKGLEDGKESIMLECAGTAIRAMNIWKLSDKSIDKLDAEQIEVAVSDYYHAPHYQDAWSCLRAMIALAIDEFSEWRAMELIALVIYFCHHFLEVPFVEAFRREMDKNWGREYQFNLAKEHQTQ